MLKKCNHFKVHSLVNLLVNKFIENPLCIHIFPGTKTQDWNIPEDAAINK